MNRKHQIKNLDYLKPYRRGLRKHLTPAEASLWILLKNRQAYGMKFRRQVSIENYIVDFYCPKLKMIIELDGEPHFTEEQAKKDKIRDEKLRNLGYHIFRYENQIVFDHPDFIFDDIKRLLPPPAKADPS
nr:endonuclease domain-containing protein [uncultured Draconibacterium sp.]